MKDEKAKAPPEGGAVPEMMRRNSDSIPQKDSWSEEFDKKFRWLYDAAYKDKDVAYDFDYENLKTFIEKNFIPLSTLHTLESEIKAALNEDSKPDISKTAVEEIVHSVLQKIKKLV